MTRPDAVLWDMDGTLLDSEKLWDLAVRELAAELGGEMTDGIRHALIGASGPNAMRILFNGLGLDPTPAALAEAGGFIEHRITDLFTTGVIPWRPGAQDALAMLLAADIPMALVTNTKRSLAEFGLDTLGRHHFRTSVCADEVPQGKPAPDLYHRAAELLGLSPNRCVVIEDSHTGAQAAEAADCALLVVPCEIPVPDAPGRIFRDSLIGLTSAELGGIAAAHRVR
ncbi:HAD family phosphatase [Nocardia uniformis]|uniref:HAD family phosphatase n=1 Tax=Nocardia uniformis TaxID=53432 RepID=A0A849BRX9_9NOCA|nr:HAD family phosphatase [Nocardia uniformis]NNH69402.1 HAD family phosphatase [Nocardia uniformis]